MKKRYWGKCEFCVKRGITDGREEVWSPLHTPAFPVSGWEALRDGGGANKIIGRMRDKTRVAHERCAEREADKDRSGISPDQQTLA